MAVWLQMFTFAPFSVNAASNMKAEKVFTLLFIHAISWKFDVNEPHSKLYKLLESKKKYHSHQTSFSRG